MATLTTTVQFLKRIAPFAGFLLIVIGLIAVIVFRATREPTQIKPSPKPVAPPKILQNPAQKRPGLIDFSQAQIPTVPKELPVFGTEKYNLSESAVKTLASSFGITVDPFLVEENTLDGRQYNWKQDTLRLTASETDLRYENRVENHSLQGNLSQNELLEKTSSFIQKIPVLPSDLVFNSEETKFLSIKKNRLVSAEGFVNAQLVEFSFDKKLAEIPIVGKTSSSTYVKIRIAKNGTIIYISSRFFNQFPEKELHELKTSQQAIAEVKNGQGSVVETALLDENGQTLELFRVQPFDVKTAAITKISLAYFLPADLKEPVQPIFVFKGNFKKDNQKGRIVIYLPALKPTQP